MWYMTIDIHSEQMDRRERRYRNRLEKKLAEKLAKEKQATKAEVVANQSPSRKFLARALTRTRIIWGIVISGLSLLGYYAAFNPHVSVEPGLLLNPGDPFTTQFDITNDSQVFTITDLNPSCYTVYVQTTNNVQQINLPPRTSPTIPQLGPREKTTITCPRGPR